MESCHKLQNYVYICQKDGITPPPGTGEKTGRVLVKIFSQSPAYTRTAADSQWGYCRSNNTIIINTDPNYQNVGASYL